MPLLLWAVFLLGTVAVTKGDYPCFCNYEVELKVLPSTDPSANPLGYMYEFDCKQILENVEADPGWVVIAFEHSIGYVQKGDRFDAQTCQGQPSVDDLVTTTAATTTAAAHTSHIHTSPDHGPSTTTPQPTTTTTTTTPAPTTTTTTTPKPTTTTTTTPVPTTTTTTPAPTTTMRPTIVTTTTQLSTPSSPVPNPTSSFVSGHTGLCPASITGNPAPGLSVVAQWGHKCYQFVDKYTVWTVAEQWCNLHGGHLVTIESQAEQDYITGFMLKNWPHPVWIGLHDRNHEEIFEWISGAPVTYTNWTPGRKLTFSHNFDDCVYMDPRHPSGGLFTSTGGMDGGWDDVECASTGLFGEQHRFACQFDITGYSQPPTTTIDPSIIQQFSDGNINLCPGRLLQNSPHSNIGQHGHYCYEISIDKHTWDNSETMCRRHGGHLATISNQDEQDFVSAFLHRHSPQYAVWLGLNDVNIEGRFEWTSGMPVNYTNWIPGHQDNFESHRTEDCVAFVPYKSNTWDDIPCGYDAFFETGETHYAFCQYKISSTTLIG